MTVHQVINDGLNVGQWEKGNEDIDFPEKQEERLIAVLNTLSRAFDRMSFEVQHDLRRIFDTW